MLDVFKVSQSATLNISSTVSLLAEMFPAASANAQVKLSVSSSGCPYSPGLQQGGVSAGPGSVPHLHPGELGAAQPP